MASAAGEKDGAGEAAPAAMTAPPCRSGPCARLALGKKALFPHKGTMRPSQPTLAAGLTAALLLAAWLAAAAPAAPGPGVLPRLALPGARFELRLEYLTGSLELSGQAQADETGGLSLPDLGLVLRRGRLKLPAGWAPLPEVRLNATGRLPAEGGLAVKDMRLRVPGLVELAGSLRLPAAGPPEGRLSGRLPDVPALMRLLAPSAAGLPLPRSFAALLDLGRTVVLNLDGGPEGLSTRLALTPDGEEAWEVALTVDTAPALPGGPLAFAGRLGLPQDGPAALDGELSLGAGRGRVRLAFPTGGPTGGFDLTDVPLEFLAALLGRLGHPLPADTSGRLSAALRLTPAGPLPLAGSLTLAGLSFASADGYVLGQDVGLTIEARPGRDGKTLDLDLATAGGEVLAGTFYARLADLPLRLSARLARAKDGFTARDLSASVGDLVSLAGRAGLAGETLNGTMKVEMPDLGRLFAGLIKDSLAGADPAWAEAEAAGRLDLDLDIETPLAGTPIDLAGRLAMTGAGLAHAPGGLSLTGLDLDLPFTYRLRRLGGAPAGPSLPPLEAARWGRLRLARFTAGPLSVMDAGLGLALTPNRLDTAGSLTAEAYGASLGLSELFVREPLGGEWEASGAFSLDGLSLAALPTGDIPLSGRVGGRLPRWRLSAGSLATEGALGGEFFGGALTVWDIGADQPLAGNRTLGANILVKSLDLAALSEALGIGRITGRMDLDLRDFTLAYGQPVAFHLLARSVPAPGVAQQVSLKAVDSITRVGTGNPLTGLGVGLLAAVFKQFPYEAVGFYCDLENDVFRIRGLINEDGVEYIIKRPPLIGINVVNSNPTNRISFSDMKERVGRVVGSARPEKLPSAGQEDGP